MEHKLCVQLTSQTPKQMRTLEPTNPGATLGANLGANLGGAIPQQRATSGK